MTQFTDVEAFMAYTGPLVSMYLDEKTAGLKHVPEDLLASMRYSLLSGGKRLRPSLCLATATSLNVPMERALPAAAALECIHCYSLIHDDLPCMDDDDLRRGKPTNHRVFGEATALLAGDALLTLAFDWLSEPLDVPRASQLRMVATLASAAGASGMVGGQAADMTAQGTEGTLAQLEYIHVNKTGKLIQASVLLGALFADVTEMELEAFRQFGLDIGIAFQIVDDLLDVIGTTEELGKHVGADDAMGKLTYPKLLGVEATKQAAEEKLHHAFRVLEDARIEAPLLNNLAKFIVSRRK